MRHSINIMFGQHFAQTIQDLKKHVLKYGETEHSPYFNAIHWLQSPNGDVSLSKVEVIDNNSSRFISGLNNLYAVELVDKKSFVAKEKEDAIKQYFDDLWASTMVAGNSGDYNELHICIYIPRPLQNQLILFSCKI